MILWSVKQTFLSIEEEMLRLNGNVVLFWNDFITLGIKQIVRVLEIKVVIKERDSWKKLESLSGHKEMGALE